VRPLERRAPAGAREEREARARERERRHARAAFYAFRAFISSLVIR
jgi:hypothetical protein